MCRRFTRTASIFITFFGCLINAALTVQVAAAWRSFTYKGEQESEWEALGDKWHTNGLKFVWGLSFVYFALSGIISAVGLCGVLKRKASHVRFYRDYSIADFAFCSVTAVVAAYAAFLRSARVGLCEELSQHPDIMRDMLEIGLNLENCELWLERAVFAIVVGMFVVLVVRLHFLLAVSKYHSQLTRYNLYPYSPYHTQPYPYPFQRILLLPNFSHNSDINNIVKNVGDVEMVYAPVPRHSLPKELQEQATEAWISTASSNHHGHHRPSRHHQHHHHHHHHHRHRSSSKERTGRIRLDIAPGEGLSPVYASGTEA